MSVNLLPPPISVVMPVHNALPHLDEAVRSVLSQTCSEFEFIILDDASTDGSTERLRYWANQDSRIRLLLAERNLGPALSSNRVAGAASAPLVARMDADDISHPERLARQAELLRKNPQVGLVGTLCELIDAQGRKLRDPEIWRLVRTSAFVPFPHGSIMYRRDVYDRVGGYREDCEFWEDQDLVLRMAAKTEILVIPEALYKHRQSSASTRVASEQARVERAVDLMYRSMESLRRNRSYESLIANRADEEGRVDPRVFISLGSLHLWAGGRPAVLGSLIRKGKLGPDLRTVNALVWASWAQIGPGSLRRFLTFLVRARNGMAAAKVSKAPVEWQPSTVRGMPKD